MPVLFTRGWKSLCLPIIYLVLSCVCLSIVSLRQQDEELDELSRSVERIGDVGLTIHEELLAQVVLYVLLTLSSAFNDDE